MLIEYLEEYLELVSTMNYTAAARRLNITQSALSKHMAALEKEFDATFIDRSKQQIELTQQGRLVCEEAAKILDAYHAAHVRIHSAAGEVKIAGSLRDSAIQNIQSRAQDALRSAGSTIHVVSQSHTQGTLAEALKDRKVDIVVDIASQPAAGNPHDAAIDETYLTSVPLLAVVASTHHLAQCESLTVADLASEKIMHPTGSMDIQQGSNIIEALFARHDVKMRKHIFYASSWNDFPSVDWQDDVFIMPRSLFNRQLFGSQMFEMLRGIPLLDEDARFPYGISVRHGETNPTVLAYAEALLDAAREIEG